MAEKLIKKLNNREFYAKYSDYAAMDEDGERLSDRKVKSVSLDAASGTMTVASTDGDQEIPVVPVPDQEGKVLKSNADGTYAWGAAGAEPGSGKLYVKFGSAPEVDTNFNANSDSKVTLVIPLATAEVGNHQDGLMSYEDKDLLYTVPGKLGGLDDRISTIENDYVTSQGLQTALSPIESEVDSLGGQVGSLTEGKADKVSQATSGNLASLDAGGDLADSGISGTAVSDALTKLDGIASGAEVNTVVTVKVNGSALAPDANRAVDIDISGKVDKVDGKQLSTEDYTTEEKTKLAQVDMDSKQDALNGLPTMAANMYLQTDANQNIVWGTLPAEKDEVAIYSYGSNASGIYSDYQQGKAIFCKYNSSKLIPLSGVGSNCYSFDGVINDDGGVSYSGPRFIHIELSGTSSWAMKVFKIPEPSSGYANRVLTVDSNGAPQWVAPATMSGATQQAAGASGLVPAPAAGDNGKFLKGDGTWESVLGLVTSVTYDENNEKLSIVIS